jgi:hypothetical protein
VGPRIQPELWELTDHACRVCFGRVLKGDMPADYAGPDAEHVHRWRCSNCAAQGISRLVSSVCACGMRLKSGRDAGIRCERNPAPTPEFPSEVTASQVLEAAGR